MFFFFFGAVADTFKSLLMQSLSSCIEPKEDEDIFSIFHLQNSVFVVYFENVRFAFLAHARIWCEALQPKKRVSCCDISRISVDCKKERQANIKKQINSKFNSSYDHWVAAADSKNVELVWFQIILHYSFSSNLNKCMIKPKRSQFHLRLCAGCFWIREELDILMRTRRMKERHLNEHVHCIPCYPSHIRLQVCKRDSYRITKINAYY